MDVLSWNCRGVSMGLNIFALKNLASKVYSSIVFLCETNIDNLDDFRSLARTVADLGFIHAEEVLNEAYLATCIMVILLGLYLDVICNTPKILIFISHLNCEIFIV